MGPRFLPSTLVRRTVVPTAHGLCWELPEHSKRVCGGDVVEDPHPVFLAPGRWEASSLRKPASLLEGRELDDNSPGEQRRPV